MLFLSYFWSCFFKLCKVFVIIYLFFFNEIFFFCLFLSYPHFIILLKLYPFIFIFWDILLDFLKFTKISKFIFLLIFFNLISCFKISEFNFLFCICLIETICNRHRFNINTYFRLLKSFNTWNCVFYILYYTNFL